MKKSGRISEKLVSSGLPGLQVATRLHETPRWPIAEDERLASYQGLIVQKPISTTQGLNI